jgi:hypothetical protein
VTTAKQELERFARDASEQDALTALAVLHDRAPEELRTTLPAERHPDSLAIDREVDAGRVEQFASDEEFKTALARWSDEPSE